MKAKSEKASSYEHVGEGLFRYVPTGKYYARIQVNLKDIRKSLRTTDPALARRRLRDLRSDLERTGGNSEQISVEQLCDRYLKTVQHQAKKTMAAKERAARAVKESWPGGARVHISNVPHSQVASWLASCPSGPDTYNVRLDFIRAAFDLALRDRLIAHSPVDGIKTRKRKKEKDPTPSVTEFNSIVSHIREQEASAHAEDSGDLVEFMALAGLGQAEIWPMTWENIDWEREIMTAFRKKNRPRLRSASLPCRASAARTHPSQTRFLRYTERENFSSSGCQCSHRECVQAVKSSTLHATRVETLVHHACT